MTAPHRVEKHAVVRQPRLYYTFCCVDYTIADVYYTISSVYYTIYYNLQHDLLHNLLLNERERDLRSATEP